MQSIFLTLLGTNASFCHRHKLGQFLLLYRANYCPLCSVISSFWYYNDNNYDILRGYDSKYSVRLHVWFVTDYSKNIARFKPTYQSSTEHEGLSYRAVVGDLNPRFCDVGSCTHTDGKGFAWWAVDLLEYACVHHVIITNRGDCCCKYTVDYNLIHLMKTYSWLTAWVS